MAVQHAQDLQAYEFDDPAWAPADLSKVPVDQLVEMLNPTMAGAWLEHANALYDQKQVYEAIIAYDRSVALNPKSAGAWNNRGNALQKGRWYVEALKSYDKALALDPGMESAWLGRGATLRLMQRHCEAIQAYARLVELNPERPFAIGMLLHQKLLACDWADVRDLIARVERDMEEGRPSVEPFCWQAVSSDPASIARCAVLCANTFPSPVPSAAHHPAAGDKIRIGYVSGEFRSQATSQLLVGVLEQHDRTAFEIYGFDNGRDDGSDMRRRVTAAFKEIVPIAELSDDEAVAAIRAREIDVLVNLNGYFGDDRNGVFARRPAPIQVNWLGFPGTLGATYMDYIVADRTVIPEREAAFFTEKIAWLPHSYQANDDKKPIAETGSRAEHGLPKGAFVFCCFNNSYKIMPDLFARWMRILGGVPGSVLWLLHDNAEAAANLKNQVRAHGVDPERLIFAPRQPLPQHLARHRLADLFLDTLPCNAHTTASDTLWAGLPLLTCRGTAFCGRVAASLLNAVGLPELIAETPEEYEDLALELARSPQRLAALRQKLATNSRTHPLFDTAGFTRALEGAFTAMQERRHAGMPPDHITVSD